MVYPYVTMTAGTRVGKTYSLDPTDENQIGRGTDCDIVLTDPLCSRVHAIVVQENDGWWLRDASSRNGSFVNGQKINEAKLVDGCFMRVGSTEFSFHLAEQPPTACDQSDGNVTQTIIKDKPIDSVDMDLIAWTDLQESQHSRDLLLLYQLSLKLLRCNDPDEVIEASLELLHERTRASLVGFLWLSDEGELKPKHFVPPDAAEQVSLSDTLTQMVCNKRHAVWIANEASGTGDSLNDYADAVCVPLSDELATLGAIHVYLERGRFPQEDFEFTISLANILVAALVRARQQATLEASHARLVSKSAQFDDLIGDSKPMQELKSKIARVARATGCVLIRGESGSGKELVSRALHVASTRADRPMLSVNCAAIPGDLMESQLFGHKKGAFTGAEIDHVGWFEQSDSGTLFLDEVGEMTLDGQAKLLRILEGHPFLPVGATKEVCVDVRVIAATNRDLSDIVREKKFREDLYYRLSVFELYIPPLRDRGEDIALLMDFFLDHFKTQHGRPLLQFSKAARQKLLKYTWPGNVRQLRNVIDSAVVMADSDEIMHQDLGLRDAGIEELDSLRIDFWERKLVNEALKRAAGSVPEAAKLLGIGRATMYRKIDEYGIER